MNDQLIQSRPTSRRSGLGDRLRQLRINRGMTQTELAGDRFSKEYVSQIERGKTRPTSETVGWLAARLGVDETFLESGVSSGALARTDSLIARAEAAVESQRYDEGLEALKEIAQADLAAAPDLEFRARLAEAWAHMYTGQVRKSLTLIDRARVLAESPSFSDVERAEVLYRLGCCRVKLSSISTAVTLYTQALELAERSGLPCDRLRAHILEWRSRCYQRQRDWEAAREDVDRALELADGLNDRHTMAHVYFQASLVAERQGRWVLARSYAERAKGIYEDLNDQTNAGNLLNNLGGLTFLLGRPDEAITYLKDAFRVALEIGNDLNAAYAVSSMAQVHLRTGEIEKAEEQARHALELLGTRQEVLEEVGNAQLVLGRSLMEQGRLDEAETVFGEADASLAKLSSASHRAA